MKKVHGTTWGYTWPVAYIWTTSDLYSCGWSEAIEDIRGWLQYPPTSIKVLRLDRQWLTRQVCTEQLLRLVGMTPTWCQWPSSWPRLPVEHFICQQPFASLTHTSRWDSFADAKGRGVLHFSFKPQFLAPPTTPLASDSCLSFSPDLVLHPHSAAEPQTRANLGPVFDLRVSKHIYVQTA